MFDKIHKNLINVSRMATWVGGLALLVSAIMVTLDVISRKLFSITISGSDEITGYVFAASTAWAYSFTLLTRSNIRIDAVYNLLGTKPKAVLDLIGLALLMYYVFLLTKNGWGMFLDNVEFNSTAQTTLATPLWIPQIFWISGLSFFLICLVFLMIFCIVCLIRGDWKKIGLIAGVKSVEEELKEEIHV